MLMVLVVIWSAVTVVLIGLSIYRSILVFREDDQIFVAAADTALEAQQAATLRRIEKVEFVLKAFTVASGSLLLLAAALWVYKGLYG